MHALFIKIPSIAKALSNTWLEQFVLAVRFYYFLLTRKYFCFKSDFEVRCFFRGKNFSLYLKQLADIDTVKDIFVDESYALDVTNQPELIIDLGAHFGDSVIYFHCLYPNAKIIAVEPSSESYSRLLKLIKSCPSAQMNIKPVNVAVGAYDGAVEFTLMPNRSGDSIINRPGSIGSVSVVQMTLKSLISHFAKEQDVDLLKFDIEGAEFTVFNNSDLVAKIQNLVGELHFDLTDTVMDDFSAVFVNHTHVYTVTNNPNRFIFHATLKDV